MRTKCLVKSFLAALFTLLMLLPVALFAQADFYKGKTITIVQGRDPGGTGDMRVRAMIPLLQKYIPGTPSIVSEYMPGGGGRGGLNRTAEPRLARGRSGELSCDP